MEPDWPSYIQVCNGGLAGPGAAENEHSFIHGGKSKMSLRTDMVVCKWACSVSWSGWWMGTIGGWKKGVGMGMRVRGGGVGVEV